MANGQGFSGLHGKHSAPPQQLGMHNGRDFTFPELIAHLPHKEFQKCVARYDCGSQ